MTYHEVPFFSYARAEKLDGFEMTPVAIGRNLHDILTIHRIRAAQSGSAYQFVPLSARQFICNLLKMLKKCIYAQSLLQHLECWNRLGKLTLFFLYNFQRKHSFIKN